MNVLEVFEYNQHFVAMMNSNTKALEKAHQSRIGTHHTEEAKKRISEKVSAFQKGRKRGPYKKKNNK